MTMTIGFLGLGGMGAAMAANLVRAGHRVRVWNRSPDPVARLVDAGASACDSPAAAARGADLLISMLADDRATREVVIDGGALAALGPGAVHASMATISVALSRELAAAHAARGAGYVAAPVLGRTDAAAAAKLNILAAGDAALLDRLQPVFDVLGARTWRFGDEPEQANAVKLAANFMLANAIEGMAEASALAGGYGVSRTAFLDMITNTIFAAPAYKGYGALIAQKKYDPAGFKLTLGLKDVRLALEASEAVHVPMPVAGVVRDNFLDAIAHGDGDLDWSALAEVAARRAGQG